MSNIIQVIAAIALVLILLIIAFYVYNYDEIKALTQSSKVQKQIKIFSGMYDLKNAPTYDTTAKKSQNSGFSTSDPSDPTYLDIEYSVNQKSGAEMTYTFWLYLDYSQDGTNNVFVQSTGTKTFSQSRKYPIYADQGLTKLSTAGVTASLNNTLYSSSPANDFTGEDTYTAANVSSSGNAGYQPVILFVRGETVARIYKGLCYDDSAEKTASSNPTVNGKPKQAKADVLVKCPLVKLENNGDVLSVEFNTTYSPDAMIENAKNTCNNNVSNSWTDVNSYKIAINGLTGSQYQKNFFLVTITLQDTYPSDPISIRNKIRARIYINKTLQLDTYINYNSFSFSEWNSQNSLKMNNGNLYVSPQIYDARSLNPDSNKQKAFVYSKTPTNANEIVMADLTYYNYALNANQISSIYSAGFNKKTITSLLYDNSISTQGGINLTPGTAATGLNPSTTQFAAAGH